LAKKDRKTNIVGWKTPKNGSIKHIFQAGTDRRRQKYGRTAPPGRGPGPASPTPRRPTTRRRKRSESAASRSFFRRAKKRAKHRQNGSGKKQFRQNELIKKTNLVKTDRLNIFSETKAMEFYGRQKIGELFTHALCQPSTPAESPN
jgi:hypothetical protein